MLIILLIIFSIFLKEFLQELDGICVLLRDFTRRNSGVFTVFFMFLFFMEQILLIVIVFYFFDVALLVQLLISIFALIVITTASLEKFILEKKYQYLVKEVNIVTYENQEMLLEMKRMLSKKKR